MDYEAGSSTNRTSKASVVRLPWWQGWIPLLLLPATVFFCFADNSPPWALMWLLAGAIFASCKWLTWRRTPAPAAPWWLHAGYLLAWPGMAAEAFLKVSGSTRQTPCTRTEWLTALAKFLLGLVLYFGLARQTSPQFLSLRGWTGLVGLILLLHFGVFHILSCAWRSMGIPAHPIMNRPLTTSSLSEFWGRRWNTAFRDLTNRFLFRPLLPSCGIAGAYFIGFFISGLVHDLVISIPARGGYGGPTVFFLIQFFSIRFTHSSLGKKLRLKTGWRGWCVAVISLLAPLGLLFHRPFVFEIILPFMKATGAIA